MNFFVEKITFDNQGCRLYTEKYLATIENSIFFDHVAFKCGMDNPTIELNTLNEEEGTYCTFVANDDGDTYIVFRFNRL